MYTPKLVHRLGAEALGTFWLVFIGCGAAMFAGKVLAPNLDGSSTSVGIGFLGIAFAFGITVTCMAYAVGHVSGAHFNPAVTIGAAVAKRFEWREVPAYVGAQLVGGLLAGGALAGLNRSRGLSSIGNMAANGYGAASPTGFGLGGVLIAEALITAFFVYVILGATTEHAPTGFAPLAIGLALFLAHLVLIPISNASVNPARSTAVAFFNGGQAPGQLWAFWLAPLVGAAIAGATYAWITGIDRDPIDISGETRDLSEAENDTRIDTVAADGQAH